MTDKRQMQGKEQRGGKSHDNLTNNNNHNNNNYIFIIYVRTCTIHFIILFTIYNLTLHLQSTYE